MSLRHLLHYVLLLGPAILSAPTPSEVNGVCSLPFSSSSEETRCLGSPTEISPRDFAHFNERALCNCCLPASSTTTNIITRTTVVNYKTTLTEYAATATSTITPVGTIGVTYTRNVVVSTKIYTQFIDTTPISTETSISTTIPTVTLAASAPTTWETTTVTTPGPSLTVVLVNAPTDILKVKRALTTTSICSCFNSGCLSVATTSSTTTITATYTTLISKQVRQTTTTTVTDPTSWATSVLRVSRSITEYNEVFATATGPATVSVVPFTEAESTLYITPATVTSVSTLTTPGPASTTSTYLFYKRWPVSYMMNNYWPMGGALGQKPSMDENAARTKCAMLCAQMGDNCQTWGVEYLESVNSWETGWHCGFWGIRPPYTNTWNEAWCTYSSSYTAYSYSGFEVYQHATSTAI